MRRSRVSPERFWLAAALLTLGTLVVPGTSPAAPARKKIALLIGVQSYSRIGPEWQDLDGAVNDVSLVRRVLIDRFGFEPGNIEMLVDLEATRSNIEAAFERLRRRARGAMVYVHYSGHGSRVLDMSGDERERKKDSTLVPIDARTEGSREILDDEINVWLDRLLEVTPDVTFIVDACHSGTITRGSGSLKTRGAPTEDTRPYNIPGTGGRSSRDLNADGRRFVRISAAMDHQLAQEFEAPDGSVHGLLTWEWCSALMSVSPGASYIEAFQVASARMFHIRKDQQRPQIEGASQAVILSGEFPERPVTIAVTEAAGNRIRFQGGLLGGVTKGSVFALSSRPGEPRDLEVRIDSVGAFEALGTSLNDNPVRPGDLFQEVRHAYPFPLTRVLVRADLSSSPGPSVDSLLTLTRLLESRVREVQGVRLMFGDERPDMILEVRPSRGGPVCVILDGSESAYGSKGLDPRVVDTILREAADADRVAWKVSRLIANQTVQGYAREFDRPEKNVLLRLVYWPPGEENLPANGLDVSGDLFEIPARCTVGVKVDSRMAQEVYLTVLNVTPRGQSQHVLRSGGDGNRILPGTSRVFPLAELVDTGMIDSYICFVTGSQVQWPALDGPPLDRLEVVRGDEGPGSSFDAIRKALDTEPAVTRSGGSFGLVTRTFSVFVTP